MRWTTQKPAKPGYYWCVHRDPLMEEESKMIVKIYSSDLRNPNAVDTIYGGGSYNLKTATCFLRWSDEPIPEPSP